MKIRQFSLFLLLSLILQYAPTTICSENTSHLSEKGINITQQTDPQNKWTWEFAKHDSNLSKQTTKNNNNNNNKNDNLIISFANINLETNSEYEIDLKQHSKKKDSYLCFGLFPKDKLNQLLESPNQSHKKDAIVACTDDFLNNPYGTIAKSGLPSLRQAENYKIKFKTGLLLIESTHQNSFKADYIIDTDQNYVPYIEFNEQSQYRLMQLNPDTDQPYDKDKQEEEILPEDWVWKTPSSSIESLQNKFSSQSSEKGNIYVPLQQGILYKTTWTIDIEYHENGGWICLGVTPTENLPVIESNPSQSFYKSSSCACTDLTYYNESSPDNIKVQGPMPTFSNATGKKFAITYKKNLLVISNEEYNGTTRVEIALNPQTSYIPWVELNGKQTIKINDLKDTNTAPTYTFNWYTPSQQAQIKRRKARSRANQNAAIFLNSDPLIPETIFSVTIKTHLQRGWICMGVVEKSLEKDIKAAPNMFQYQKSASACTDRSFYNKFGNLELNDSSGNTMPKQEESENYTFFITYRKDHMIIEDNTGKFHGKFFLNEETEYIPYVEIFKKNKVSLPFGEVFPQELPQNFLEYEEKKDLERIQEDNFVFNGHWKSYSSYGDLDETNILSTQSSQNAETQKYINAFSTIKLQPYFHLQYQILQYNNQGYICAGIIDIEEESDLRYEADESYLDNSITVCTNGMIYYQEELLQESGQINDPDSPLSSKTINLVFYKSKLTINFGFYSATFSYNPNKSYLPYVEATEGNQKIHLKQYQLYTPQLVPIQQYDAFFQTFSKNGLIFEDNMTISSKNTQEDAIINAFSSAPLRPFQSIDIEVILHTSDTSSYICFGLFPYSQKDRLKDDPDTPKHSLSVSACTDDTFFDYFDPQSIEKYNQISYIEDTISKKFTLTKYENILKIHQKDSDFHISFRIDSTELYIPFIELKGKQIVKVSNLITYRKSPKGQERLEHLQQLQQEQQKQQEEQQKQAKNAQNSTKNTEKQVQIDPDLHVYGQALWAGKNMEKQLTSEKGQKSVVLANYPLHLQTHTWYIKFLSHGNNAIISIGLTNENYIKSIINPEIDHSMNKNVVRISTDGSFHNGQGDHKTEGKLAKQVKSVGKIYKFTYTRGSLTIEDLGSSFKATLDLKVSSNYYFYLQIFGQTQLQITETKPQTTQNSTQNTQNSAQNTQNSTQNTQNTDSSQDHSKDFQSITESPETKDEKPILEDSTTAEDEGDEEESTQIDGEIEENEEFLFTDFEKFGENLKKKHQKSPEKYYLKSTRQGSGLFISKYLLFSESKTFYFKITKISKKGHFLFSLIKNKSGPFFKANPTQNLQNHSETLGLDSSGFVYNNILSIQTQKGDQKEGQDNKSVWYRCYFNADDFTFSIWDLEGNFKVVYNLHLQSSYLIAFQLKNLVKIRVSDLPPQEYQQKINEIESRLQQPLSTNFVDSDDPQDDDSDDNEPLESQQDLQNATQAKTIPENPQNTSNNDGESQNSPKNTEKSPENIETNDGEEEEQGKLPDGVSEWQHSKNSDRGKKLKDEICVGDDEKPVNFFVDSQLKNGISWSYKILKHEPQGWVCFGILPYPLFDSLISLPDHFHYEESVSVCTDGTYYNGPNNHHGVYVQGKIAKKEKNTGKIYQITYYSDKLIVQEEVKEGKEGEFFKIEFTFSDQIKFLPWFEVYGNHLLSFVPKNNFKKLTPFERIQEKVDSADITQEKDNQKEEKQQENDGESTVQSAKSDKKTENETNSAKISEQEEGQDGEITKSAKIHKKDGENDSNISPESAKTEENDGENSPESAKISKKDEEKAKKEDQPSTNSAKVQEQQQDGEISDNFDGEADQEIEGGIDADQTPSNQTNNQGEIKPKTNNNNNNNNNKPKDDQEEHKPIPTESESSEILDGEDYTEDYSEEEDGDLLLDGEKLYEEAEKQKKAQNKLQKCMTLYSECGYNGVSVNVCGDDAFDFDHEVKSVKVPYGQCLSLLNLKNFQGYTGVLMGDVECIEDSMDEKFLLQNKIKFYKGDIAPQNEISSKQVKNGNSYKSKFSKKQHLRRNSSSKQSKKGENLRIQLLSQKKFKSLLEINQK